MKILRRFIVSAAAAIETLAASASVDSQAVEAPDSVSVDEEQLEVFSRNIEQITFVPKGQWIAGVSVSFSQSSQNKYQFLVLENLNGDTYSYSVSPMLMYAFADNQAIGIRGGYKRQRTHLNSADVVLASDTEYGIDNLYSISHNYYGMAAYRMYLSLGNSTRFGLVNEVQMELGGGQSKLCSGTGADLTGTYEQSFNFDIGLSPGLVMFLSDYSAIEVNVGVLGFGYNHTKSTTDQIYVANRHTKHANFRVNLFSITFGVTFYL